MNDIMPDAATLIAVAPAKIRNLLEPAHARGLTISLTDHTYGVASPNPIDDHQLWFHYTPGRNGGRISVTLYRPNYSRSRMTTITQRDARSWITEMADGLDRHNARQAEARKAAEEAPATEQAVALSARLNRAGRVALRLVRSQGPARGKLSVATHSKIKGAFRRWGLVDANNTLTDLGRAVRTLVVS